MSDLVLCVIEIPKGSRNKYEWDQEEGLMLLDRFLSSSVVFPTDYGFVRRSIAEDGDPWTSSWRSPSPPLQAAA